jgi:hypothetical protein
MRKRTYEETFGEHYEGDILSEITYKYLNSCGSEFNPNCMLVNQNLQNINEEIRSKVQSYHQYLNYNDYERPESANAIHRDIENINPNILDQPEDETPLKPAKEELVCRAPEEISGDSRLPIIPIIPLKEDSFEKLEIEYLERMTRDCRIPVNAEMAGIMKTYTNILINTVADEKDRQTIKGKAENVVLKKAFITQINIIDVKHG